MSQGLILNFVARWVVTTGAVAFATWLLPGMWIEGDQRLPAIILTGLVLAFLNAIVRPILVLLTFPITLVTFGLFLLALNGFVLGLASLIVPEFHVDGFWWAVLGALIISLASGVLNMLLRGKPGWTFTLERKS